MIQNGNTYKADKGCFIIRINDHFIMGEEIVLGSADSIENYIDEPYTEESYKLFYERLGIDIPIEETEEEV